MHAWTLVVWTAPLQRKAARDMVISAHRHHEINRQSPRTSVMSLRVCLAPLFNPCTATDIFEWPEMIVILHLGAPQHPSDSFARVRSGVADRHLKRNKVDFPRPGSPLVRQSDLQQRQWSTSCTRIVAQVANRPPPQGVTRNALGQPSRVCERRTAPHRKHRKNDLVDADVCLWRSPTR